MPSPVRTRRLFKFNASAVSDEFELDFEDFAGRRTKLVLTADQLREITDKLVELTPKIEQGVSFSQRVRKAKG
ncbi:hypothetical protein [Microvirga rosea]|uniref:hypothetical protein n=1 Tax=Microvirga rosea TaxID=2715425 RepID=UPI001D0A7041|nr:hypothetical protein [Microvirga rosea]MCB8822571.1 hypothetical protein [Microvirga rosea]